MTITFHVLDALDELPAQLKGSVLAACASP